MAVENAQFLHQLNPANPASADRLQQGDDHIRLVKAALRATFPNLTGAVTLTNEFLNGLAANLTPVGVITLFSGAEAPKGWAICNGQRVPLSDGSGTIDTPDLRGRVPVGVSAEHALGEKFGQTSKTVTTEAGGAHTHAATTAAAGSHSHAASGGTISSSKTGETVSTTTRKVDDGGSASGIVNGVTLTDPGHTHTLTGLTVTEAGSHAHGVTVEQAAAHGHAVTIDTTQPSIALHFIIKV